MVVAGLVTGYYRVHITGRTPTMWIIFVAITTLGLVGTLIGESRDDQRIKSICKPIASLSFIALAVYAGAFDSGYGTGIFVGLVLCLFGDVFLLFRDKKRFRLGLVSFLLGHVAYCVAFGVAGLEILWLAVSAAAVVAVAVVVLRWLMPKVSGDMRGPVVAYVVVISTMVVLASGTVGSGGHVLIFVGALAFYCSDLAVARDRFVKQGMINRIWGLPLYYGAQLVLAASTGIV